MKILLHPTYCPNIASFAAMVQHDVIWEVADNYQKQTYRNRAYICTDRGKHMLNIPIQHVGKAKGKQLYKNVKLDNSYAWQRQHWRTLETAYRTSPFFEFYEDEIAPLYTKSFTYLLDFNLESIAVLCECLQIDMPTEKTISFEKISTLLDGRTLANAKTAYAFTQEEYTQVFQSKHGFVENTSVLDLLFNEGTNALSYLQQQNLSPLDA
ncbi:WbqC family protein [Spongiimicrobium salis]|uniref:WbqC family protein n=1 Tax=Spongiimicrobium salis TaxID=1667022 RepID=UPI00374DB6B2